ncbi:MAG: glycosyltransferase family 4 protein [Acinetobacter sp.]
MKILVVCQYYYPEPFRITDICEELVKEGHDVTVLTGIPNYPMGRIYEGYRHGEKRNEVINGVHVHRCFTVGRRHGAIWRFINYYSFAISSSMYVNQLSSDFDVVLVNQLSPVMMANAGIKYKQKYHKKLVLYCLDLWPESLVAGGIKRNSPVYKLFHRISAKVYRSADKLLVTSRMFADYFKREFDIQDNVLEYLPQYAEDNFLLPTESDPLVEKAKETVDLMFAGNIGAVQSVETIIRAANELKNQPQIRFHVLGDGSELENCKRLAETLGLRSVIFYGRKPIDEMPQYYAMADAMLVTMQDDPVLALTLPGKIQTYMAAGKAIIGAASGETQAVINEAKCGICVNAEDYIGLADVIKEFSESDNRQDFGKCARFFYHQNFEKSAFMEQLSRVLSKAK